MIIKKLLAYINIVLALVLSGRTFAQTDSLTVHQLNGKDYYIHVIEQGNTLYFLSKQYDTPVDVIKKENPSVNDGLSVGEKIFIPLKRNEETATITDGNYILHTVEKGRTLYSLAKEYNIQQSDIIVLNPEIVNEGIKQGQIIKIPVKKIKAEIEEPADLTPQYKTHNVSAGETLYSLSKLYNVSIDSIKIVNNGLINGLKNGETIYLPLIKKRVKGQVSTINQLLQSNQVVDSLKMTSFGQDSVLKKPVYKIGLMLPFYIEENEEMVSHALQEKNIYPKSKFAIEFYHGVVLGLDSLTDKDVKFELHVFDTKGRDSMATGNILKKPELLKMDLLIGPLYYSNFELAASFALDHNIPIISPVKQNNKILLGNQYVFKAVPSKSSMVKHLAKLAIDSFSTDHLLTIAHQSSKEKSLADTYIKEYNNLLMATNDTLIYAPIKKIDLKNPHEIVGSLRKDTNNVIFVPSSNSTFITNLFSALTNVLREKSYKNCRVTLIGLEEWQQFGNIDLEYFQTLNVYMPVNQFVNFDNEDTKGVILKYYNSTSTYPSMSSFLGFDIAHYFCSNLKNSGTVFNEIESSDKSASTEFHFMKTGIESGFENTHSNIVGYRDYTIEKIN